MSEHYAMTSLSRKGDARSLSDGRQGAWEAENIVTPLCPMIFSTVNVDYADGTDQPDIENATTHNSLSSQES